jgi:hypothetical protein
MTPGTDWIDQAQRLVEALRGGPAPVVDPATGSGAEPGAAGHPADCRWCPICQAAAVVRGERPEVNAALADLLIAAATALRTVAAAGRPPEEPAAGQAEQAEQAEQPEPPAPVQRIDIA